MASEIDDLVAKDEHNVEATKQWLADFDPALPEALDAALNLFITIERAFGQDASFQESEQKVAQGAKSLGAIDWDDLTRIVGNPDELATEELRTKATEIRAALDDAWSPWIRALLLVYAARGFAWSATDLLRTRITAGWVHLRVEVEAAALMWLMRDEPSLAVKWLRVRTPAEGREFYKLTNRRVGQVIEQYGLTLVRDLGSGASAHPRMAGIAPGLSTHFYTDSRGRRVHGFQVRFHEADPEKPEFLMSHVLHLLVTQTRVFDVVRDALPELRDPLLLEVRIPQFRREVERLWQRFAATYRNYVSQLKVAAERRAAEGE